MRWEDALPTGNGTIGAMVYGSIYQERILLNHEDLWLPLFPRPTLPEMAPHLAEYRRLLLDCQFQQADAFWRAKLKDEGWPDLIYTNPNHPAFDLLLTQGIESAFSNYARRLDLTTGEATVSWTADGDTFTRKLFVSRADDLVVLQAASQHGGNVSLSARFAAHPMNEDNRKAVHYPRAYAPEELPLHFSPFAEGAWIAMDVTYPNNDGYVGVGKLIARGGSMVTDDTSVSVSGADEVLLLCKVVKGRGEPQLYCAGEIALLPADYATLLQRHLAEHQALYARVSLDLAGTELVAAGNEELLARAYKAQAPNVLIEKLFNYGRYLCIAATNAHGRPPHLQGVWNGDYLPAWSSDYTMDENVQMIHWHVMANNLPELMQPYFNYFEASLPDWRENARAFYGCRGVMTCLRQSDHGLLAENMPYLIWTAGAGWLSQAFYDYWLFTGDRDFLRDHVVPVLKDVALFYEDFFFAGEDGKLICCPSMSPENIPDIAGGTRPTMNPTMDIAVCREVLTNLIAACAELHLTDEPVARWQSMCARLPEYAINEDGAMCEWLHPKLKDNYHHRHQSHVYPLFPGSEFTKEHTPELFEACRVAVEKRLVIGIKSQTGWSLAHMANIYARLGEGDRALECLDLLTRSCLGVNLLTYHNDWRHQGITDDFGGGLPPFQIDANFGLTAAVQEMLLFSVPGLVKILPALPRRWGTGTIDGLLCRGGIRVSIHWNSTLQQIHLSLTSRTAQTITLNFPAWANTLYSTDARAIVTSSPHGEGYRTIALPANQQADFDLSFQAVTPGLTAPSIA
jgi:alpha-L-fucosidase 2